VFLDRRPPEPVEHEQHDMLRVARGRRQPVVARMRQQRRDDPGHRGAVEIGAHGLDHAVNLTLHPHNAADTRDHGSVKVSTRGDYAARALLSLALHGSDRPTSVKEIAERTTLPQPYLEQILLAVKGAGLVISKRGVGGGYVLARPPDQITLAQIIDAVEGPQLPLDEHPDHCEGHCVLQEVWVCVSDESRRMLERFTLANLVERARVGHPDASAT
jgi:Rrf2 family protein